MGFFEESFSLYDHITWHIMSWSTAGPCLVTDDWVCWAVLADLCAANEKQEIRAIVISCSEAN